ncbi:hypothetical protein K466DRAFT_600361 [Polyporus arcularius HHB13444]|uniref:Myb/SANT-like domain-containing protein n=1 Tax=Polyporus arcularius HHB13444 TaxID=1314778 RepID=A0A5C3P9S6_9APHY|nr:hypothetical protein K466DRAFT_600361 [Polyporus arcularius HHB13444]
MASKAGTLAATSDTTETPAKAPKASEEVEADTPAPTVTGKKQHAVWRSCDDAILVKVLKEQRDAGNQADNGWKQVAWNAAAAALVGGPGGVKSWTGCRDHWRYLVQDYNLVHWLMTKVSGLGWDEEMKCVTAPPQVWEYAIKERREVEKFRGKPFPLYHEIGDLVAGRQATGQGTYRVSGQRKKTKKATNKATDSANPEVVNEESAAAPTPASPEFEFSYGRSSSAEPLPTQLPCTPERGRGRSSDGAESQSNSPVSRTQKRHRSPSSSPIPSASAKHSRITGPVAVNNVAGAMSQIANSIGASATEIATPTRRQKAVRTVAADKSLASNVKLRALKLFSRDIAICDSYLAIEDRPLRNEFLLGVLDDAESV